MEGANDDNTTTTNTSNPQVSTLSPSSSSDTSGYNGASTVGENTNGALLDEADDGNLLDFKSEIEQKEHENFNLKLRINHLENLILALKESTDDTGIEVELARYKQAYHEADSEKTQYAMALDRTKNASTKLKHELQSAIRARNDLQSQLATSEAKIKSLEKTSSTSTDLEVYKSQVKNLTTALKNSTEKIALLEKEQLVTEHETSTEIQKLVTEVETLRRAVVTAEKVVGEKTLELSAEKSRRESLETENARAFKDVESQLHAGQVEAASRNTRVSHLEALNEDLRKQLSSLEASNSSKDSSHQQALANLRKSLESDFKEKHDVIKSEAESRVKELQKRLEAEMNKAPPPQPILPQPILPERRPEESEVFKTYVAQSESRVSALEATINAKGLQITRLEDKISQQSNRNIEKERELYATISKLNADAEKMSLLNDTEKRDLKKEMEKLTRQNLKTMEGLNNEITVLKEKLVTALHEKELMQTTFKLKESAPITENSSTVSKEQVTFWNKSLHNALETTTCNNKNESDGRWWLDIDDHVANIAKMKRSFQNDLFDLDKKSREELKELQDRNTDLVHQISVLESSLRQVESQYQRDLQSAKHYSESKEASLTSELCNTRESLQLVIKDLQQESCNIRESYDEKLRTEEQKHTALYEKLQSLNCKSMQLHEMVKNLKKEKRQLKSQISYLTNFQSNQEEEETCNAVVNNNSGVHGVILDNVNETTSMIRQANEDLQKEKMRLDELKKGNNKDELIFDDSNLITELVKNVKLLVQHSKHLYNKMIKSSSNDISMIERKQNKLLKANVVLTSRLHDLVSKLSSDTHANNNQHRSDDMTIQDLAATVGAGPYRDYAGGSLTIDTNVAEGGKYYEPRLSVPGSARYHASYKESMATLTSLTDQLREVDDNIRRYR